MCKYNKINKGCAKRCLKFIFSFPKTLHLLQYEYIFYIFANKL